MTKKEVAEFISVEMGVPSGTALEFIEAFIKCVKESHNMGRDIDLRGFGSFKTVTRKARVGRDIKNNTFVKIPERRALAFKQSKAFYDD